MIIYSNNYLKFFHTCSIYPNFDWTGEADFVVDETNPENAELIKKIKELAPCFDYMTDDYGNLIDVVKNDVVLPEPELEPESEPIEDATYDELAKAIQEGVNEV